MSQETTERPPRFAIGARVKIDNRDSTGHCRAPRYLRGLTGEVCRVQGVFRDPERLAYYRPGLPPLPLYKVRIPQSAIWPDYSGPSDDDLEVDVYENWLKPTDGA